MILVYCTTSTKRTDYIFQLFFNELIGTAYQITHSKEEFIGSELPKINYSNEKLGDEFFIQSNVLLFDHAINPQRLEFSTWENQPIFYLTQNSSIPFDIFAASFFLVTRYEEYLPYRKDHHGRYPVKESTAFKRNFLNKPLVNIWAEMFLKEFLKKYPSLPYTKRQYEYVPTIDVDNAYAFLHKGFFRTLSAICRAYLRFDFIENHHRIFTLLRFKKDRYDNFDYIKQILKKFDKKTVFFYLLGKYGRYDRNISPKNKTFRALIRSTADSGEVGIHPSYKSYKNLDKIEEEIKTLKRIIGTQVTKSRLHYLRLNIPETYQILSNLNIKDDYSMGYPKNAGFRASICIPHKFFDLTTNTKYDITIHPFQIMDRTLKSYLKMGPERAKSLMEEYAKQIRKVNGEFGVVWHNESLSDEGNWKGWRNVFESSFEL